MERLRKVAAVLASHGQSHLAREVAEVSLAVKAAMPQAGKLPSALRSKINQELIRAGLDGNGRFEKPGLALASAGDVLLRNGIEFADVISGHRLMSPEGHTSIGVAFANQEDAFSPLEITNSMLSFSWYAHDKYRYEAVAYLS